LSLSKIELRYLSQVAARSKITTYWPIPSYK
jgi:hypothetical protein